MGNIIDAIQKKQLYLVVEGIIDVYCRDINYILGPDRKSGSREELTILYAKFCYCPGYVFNSSFQSEIVGKAYFSNISALLSKLDRAQHSDLNLTIFLEVSI